MVVDLLRLETSVIIRGCFRIEAMDQLSEELCQDRLFARATSHPHFPFFQNLPIVVNDFSSLECTQYNTLLEYLWFISYNSTCLAWIGPLWYQQLLIVSGGLTPYLWILQSSKCFCYFSRVTHCIQVYLHNEHFFKYKGKL